MWLLAFSYNPNCHSTYGLRNSLATMGSTSHGYLSTLTPGRDGLTNNADWLTRDDSLHGTEAEYAANQTTNTGTNPLLFLISALVSFKCITQHTGPTALRPIQRTKHHV